MKLFTAALALAATASAAVLSRQEFETPREQPHGPYGYWTVKLSGNLTEDYIYIVTDYYNDGTYKFPYSYTTTCIHAPNADPPINSRHAFDKLGLDWSYVDGSKLQHQVLHPSTTQFNKHRA